MNIRVPSNAGNFLSSWGPVSFSKRIRLQGVKFKRKPWRRLGSPWNRCNKSVKSEDTTNYILKQRSRQTVYVRVRSSWRYIILRQKMYVFWGTFHMYNIPASGYMIWYDMIWYIYYLQLGCHPVAVVQYTFTHKNNTQNDTKQTIHRTTQQFGRVRALPRLG